MSAVVTLSERLAQLPPLPIYRFSVDQYQRLAGLGILSDMEPVELLEGLVVIKGQATMAPKILVQGWVNNGMHYPSSRVAQPLRRFSVDEYHEMFRTGLLTEEDRVELLEGWIVRKMTRNPPHDTAIALAMRLLTVNTPAGWHCRVQLALAADLSDPEPDLCIVRGSERDYSQRHPRPRDTALVVEVADTSLDTDRTIKWLLYARIGIPAYWIVNIPEQQIEVYTEATGIDPNPEYRHRHDYGLDDLVPLMIEGRQVARIAVRDLLP
jgi:Uma2 family endonuclease